MHDILTSLTNWYAMYAGCSPVVAYKDASPVKIFWGMDGKSFMYIDSRKSNYSVIYPEIHPTESSYIQSFTLITFLVGIWNYHYLGDSGN